MYMASIPTYSVTLNIGDDTQVTYRVPKTNLEAFLSVLVFNDIEDFRVELEI